MTSYLLDNNVVSAARRLAKQTPIFQAFMRSLAPKDAFIPTPVLMEIGFGIQLRRSDDPHFADDLDRWLTTVVVPHYADRILPFDEKAALRCGTLPTPNLAPTVDAMIASIALEHGLVVLTRNVKDFQPLGVPTKDPWI